MQRPENSSSMRNCQTKVQVFAKFHVAEPTVIDILAAIDIHRLHSFSFWDALIVLMAKQAGCRVLLSEDMQNGREIDGVKIVQSVSVRQARRGENPVGYVRH